MSFCFNLFSHLLLSFCHQFSYFFHVEVRNLRFLLVCPNLLNFIREKYGKLRTIEFFTIVTVFIEILLIYLFDQLSLNYILKNVRLTKLSVVLRLLDCEILRVEMLFLICIMLCPTLFSLSCSSQVKIMLLFPGFSKFLSSFKIIIVMFFT